VSLQSMTRTRTKGLDMGEITNGVSWLAVIAGAVVSFLLGWLWYSPKLFGTKWAEGSGVKMGSADKMPAAAMVSQGIGLLLMSWFVGVTANNNALFTVILATVAFTVMAFSGNSFSGKSNYARWVDAGYWIVCLVIMIICEGVLRRM
jgi:multidrug transporter EmrE-like cation transporter